MILTIPRALGIFVCRFFHIRHHVVAIRITEDHKVHRAYIVCRKCRRYVAWLEV